MSFINLSALPPPEVVESLDFEVIYQGILAEFQALMGENWSAVLESDPAVKLLEVAAYREMGQRARINDAAKAVLIAYAVGADLEQIAARFGVARLLVSAGDPLAIPPTADVWESDERLRTRAQLALESFTVAGSRGMYEYLALTASARVQHVQIAGPELTWVGGVPSTSNGIPPGMVMVYLLATDNGGIPDAPLIADVYAYLSAETRRPLCDSITVAAPTVNTYTINASLYIYPGPAAGDVLAAAQAAAQAYADALFKIGYDIRRSSLFAALTVPGVQRVELSSPAADIVNGVGHISKCTAITITIGGVDA